ncbi:MAG TPA: carboxypeptidase-like regulatory domain-containing protein, partial [Candidatus Polarisedimenticolaceae bacterium]|nr:carboxypeptidase-like regulatory domain-containing protein [Candidatus Polarisedimenticolaceae bacterium]
MTKRLVLRLFLSIIPVFLVALVGMSGQAHAADVTLSGHVTDPNNAPISGVVVSLDDPGTMAVRGTATTDGSGFYSATVAPGTYDIHFEPLPGTLLNSTVYQSSPVFTDQTLDVRLIPINHTLSGATTRDGTAFGHLDLFVLGHRQDGTQVTKNATSDVSGHYSLETEPL